MGLFDNMDDLGLAGLEEEINKDREKELAKRNVKMAPKKEEKLPEEKEFVYFKKYECPLCHETIEHPTVKVSKVRSLGHDWDLRPLFRYIDCNKYDVIYCRSCGYASLMKYYGVLPGPYVDLLYRVLVPKHKPLAETGLTIDYETAILRYTMAWANAICRRAKESEKAYLCLKTAWLYRGMKEQNESVWDEDRLAECKEKEDQYLREALNFFKQAREKERPPIAGMNDITLDFLLAALFRHFEEYNQSVQLLFGIISSKTASTVQKDKARDCLYEIRQFMKDNS